MDNFCSNYHVDFIIIQTASCKMYFNGHVFHEFLLIAPRFLRTCLPGDGIH